MTSAGYTEQSGPSIAVVICTSNRPTVLERCLQGVRQLDSPALSIVVVDSAPKSCEAKSLAARYGTKYYVSPCKGLSRARNVGTRATNEDIIVYLDDDMVPHWQWLNSLIAEFADKDVGAVTGPVLPLEFSEASATDLQGAVELKSWGPHRFQIDQSSAQWFERTNFGGVGDGNFALRRYAFDQMRGFDERLGRGATIDISEEHYAFFRLVECGLKVAYSPRALVFHPSSPMSREIYLKQITDTLAFSAFLTWNHPFRSWRVAKFLIEGIVRSRRWWHSSSRSTFDMTPLSAREKIGSGLNGFSTFLRSLRLIRRR